MTTLPPRHAGATSIDRKLVSAIMTRNVCRVGVDQSAGAALDLMQQKSVSSVLVIEDELILGIITERDIVRALSKGGKLRELSCVDLMQSPVVTVNAGARCLDAYHQMLSRGIRHIGVTDADGHVMGIASQSDVVRHFGIEYYLNFKDVGSVMGGDFCKLPPTASVADALVQMLDKHQSCVVVVDSQGRPGGVLTERDVVRLVNEDADPSKLTLRETMRSPVVTVKTRRPLHGAVKAMEDKRIRRLVVVDDNGIACGVLTHTEIARGLEGDYAAYLKEIVEQQGMKLQQTASVVDEKLLLANILRSVTGTAVLASDLQYRITYATPSVAEVLNLRVEGLRGADLRRTLENIGWTDAATALSEPVVARGACHYVVPAGSGKTDFQVSVLLDAQHVPQGYLLLAQRAH